MIRFTRGIIIVGIAAVTGLCQPKETFDLFITAGAGFAMGGRDVGVSQETNLGAVQKQTDNYLNYGSGLKIEVGANYKLMNHLYGQAALCYGNGLAGVKRVTELTGISKLTEQYGYSTFGIKVMVKPSFQVLDLFDVYTNFGVGLFFAGASVDVKNTIGTTEYVAKIEESNYPAIAYIGSLGAEYPITPSVIVFGELHGEQMNFLVRQTTISNSTIPGLDWANGVTNYEKNAVDRKTPYYTPGSNIAIRVGARFPIF
jgi:opacity protein-like surface antigen